ncbi:MAG: gluconate 5-dehydrogenase [Spirochaetes bacterium]|nr:MAG: gluconate 5-dehydrogenase [Spirochaetota bacterium]
MKDFSLFDLTGKTALITGSARGLGYAVALGLGKVGARIVLNGRHRDTLKAAAGELKGKGLDVDYSVFDVTKEKEVEKKITGIMSRYGGIDILVNNAGIQKRAPLAEFSEQDWDSVMNTNLKGVFLVSKYTVRGMLKQKAGKIINICSLMSEVGRVTIAPYTASKGGVKMLTKAMAVEWGSVNIQVNGIGPGYFETEMNTKLLEDAEFNNWVKSRTPAGRWGKPEELAGAAVFLASKASDYINGQIIYVDGGILAGL